MTEQNKSTSESKESALDDGKSADVLWSSEVENSNQEAGEAIVEEEEYIPPPELPPVALALVSLGVEISSMANDVDSRFTISLCMPCVDYAATLIGLGIIKDRLSDSNESVCEDRLGSLIGKWVSFTKKNKKTCVGILERCEDTGGYLIKITNKKHQTLWQMPGLDELHLIRPTGRDYNPNRRLSRSQVGKVHVQNSSLLVFGGLIDCDLGKSSFSKLGELFCIFGNRARLLAELDLPAFANGEGYLGKVLRPRGEVSSGDLYHCSIESARHPISEKEGQIIIIEASQLLSDHLVSSRHLNRVILVGRNMPDYDKYICQIIQEQSIGGGSGPNLTVSLTPSIISHSFYQK
jgi:hypothetical protein